jgi:hypothetical protein
MVQPNKADTKHTKYWEWRREARAESRMTLSMLRPFSAMIFVTARARRHNGAVSSDRYLTVALRLERNVPRAIVVKILYLSNGTNRMDDLNAAGRP